MVMRCVLWSLALAAGSAVAAMAAPAAPAAPDLEAEWKLQWDDLRAQMAAIDLASRETDPQKRSRAASLKKAGGEALRQEATILPADRDPLDIILRRAEAVLHEITRLGAKADLSAAASELGDLRARAGKVDPAAAADRFAVFTKVCQVRRRITLANPLSDFRDIVFVTRGPNIVGHMVPQYMGQYNSAGGGLWVLEDTFTAAPRLRDVTAPVTVSRGRLAGAKLARKAFLSPALSYDAKTIYFAYSEKRSTGAAPGKKAPRPDWSEGESFHLFRIGVDGQNLEQLTDGPWNDFDPCPLPDGRVAFVSERRGGFGRCGVPQTYTLHTMNADGSDIRPISFHETNEWNPSVTHDGLIVYSRWDYVDRGALAAHHAWITTPEGCDARSLRGNWGKVSARGNMEVHVRPVPGSQRFVATAAAHHDESFGSLILIDLQRPEEDRQQAKRITPEALLPEADGPFPMREGMFSTAWPLSEDFYLATYQPRTRRPAGTKEPPLSRAGIYLVDSFGNRELLYRDPDLGCWNPIPLRQRTVPPTLPSRTKKGEVRRMPPFEDRKPWGEVGTGGTTVSGEATVLVINAYESRRPWPAGTKIKALRVVQLYPKSSPEYGKPWIGIGNQALARGVLGVVPVEEDGSAHFILPAGKPVYFQALDERGLAVQSMLSDAYVQPGERLTCEGCHEPRYQAAKPPGAPPLAARRPPQRLTREVEDADLDAGQAMPVSFARLVQPVLQRHCVECHAREPKAGSLSASIVAAKQPPRRYHGLGWSEAYLTLGPFAWTARPGGGNGGPMVSTPGKVGARMSKLLALLSKGHYDVKLPQADLRRITLWLDCDSPFFGAYDDTEKQAKGELVLPSLE